MSMNGTFTVFVVKEKCIHETALSLLEQKIFDRSKIRSRLTINAVKTAYTMEEGFTSTQIVKINGLKLSAEHFLL